MSNANLGLIDHFMKDISWAELTNEKYHDLGNHDYSLLGCARTNRTISRNPQMDDCTYDIRQILLLQNSGTFAFPSTNNILANAGPKWSTQLKSTCNLMPPSVIFNVSNRYELYILYFSCKSKNTCTIWLTIYPRHEVGVGGVEVAAKSQTVAAKSAKLLVLKEFFTSLMRTITQNA